MESTDKEKNGDEIITTKDLGVEFFERMWSESWTYIKTVVNVVREPVLILDKDLKVIAANEPFYNTFKVESKNTENRSVYELGNGQWNIPDLKKLLEDIVPNQTFFKGFEVSHNFPTIGHKIMILNARQIHFKNEFCTSKVYPQIILLAIEDVTEMMGVAEMLANRTNQFEVKMAERTERLETHIRSLQNEINTLKKES